MRMKAKPRRRTNMSRQLTTAILLSIATVISALSCVYLSPWHLASGVIDGSFYGVWYQTTFGILLVCSVMLAHCMVAAWVDYVIYRRAIKSDKSSQSNKQ